MSARANARREPAPPGNGFPPRATRAILDRGLITVAEVHRHGLRAYDVSQSNGVVLVEAGNGRGYAVKDMRATHDPDQGSPQREVALYEAIHADPDLARFAPAYHGYDADRATLILDALVSARRLDQLEGGRRTLDPEIASWIGEALGSWHRAAASLAPQLLPLDPWVLRLEPRRRLPVLDSDERLRALVDRINADDTLAGIGARVRTTWSRETVIHGDVRFANTMVRVSPPEVRFVDWETSGGGDPAWDAGAVVQEYLSVALAGGHDDPVRTAAPTLTAFLDAYREAALKDMHWSRLRDFVASRLLLRAIQLVTWEGDAEGSIERHLWLAASVTGGDAALPGVAPT